MRRSQWSLARRVGLTFVLMIALVLIASGTGLFFNRSVDQFVDSSTTALDRTYAVTDLENTWFQVVASIDNMLLTRQTSLIEGRLEAQMETFNEQVAALQRPSSQAALIGASAALIQEMAALAGELNGTVDGLFSVARAGNWTRAQAQRHTELASLQRRFSEALTTVKANIQKDVSTLIAGSVDIQTATRHGWMSISALAVVIGAVLAFTSTRTIVSQVNRIVGSARAIQSGDLTVRAEISSIPEFAVLAEAFNGMTSQLTRSIQSLRRNVEALETASRERDRLIKELEEALLFKDQFLATMSHELRTPLNAILGYAALVLDEQALDEDIAYMVSRMEGNSQRLLKLINDVLDISRINANRIEILARPIDLPALVRALYTDFQSHAANTGLDFRLEADPALPPVIVGDEERIGQIAGNLLQNAFKFTSRGFVSLKVACQGDKLIIAISDSGLGIPETWQHLIFDEFRQVDSGSKRKFGGAGLGLSIVKKLCLLMGGSVSVSSQVDVGSTFTVTLPLRVPQPTEIVPSQNITEAHEELARVTHTTTS